MDVKDRGGGSALGLAADEDEELQGSDEEEDDGGAKKKTKALKVPVSKRRGNFSQFRNKET